MEKITTDNLNYLQLDFNKTVGSFDKIYKDFANNDLLKDKLESTIIECIDIAFLYTNFFDNLQKSLLTHPKDNKYYIKSLYNHITTLVSNHYNINNNVIDNELLIKYQSDILQLLEHIHDQLIDIVEDRILDTSIIPATKFFCMRNIFIIGDLLNLL